MYTTFKLLPKDIKYFHSLVKKTKEFGGVLKISNNKVIENKTSEKGNIYSVGYDKKNNTYGIEYHSHAYYPKLELYSTEEILKKIKRRMKTNMMDALFIFECDIMKVHPPSPQDCYICSLNLKSGMLVCAQEGIYEITYNMKYPCSIHIKEKIDKIYYTCFWGMDREYVTSKLESNNNDDVFEVLQKCSMHHLNYKDDDLIKVYLNFLKKYHFECTLIKWRDVPNHLFFS